MARTRFIENRGARLAVGLLVLGVLTAPVYARIIFRPTRFTFAIDPKTPIKDLLPAPPVMAAPPAPCAWTT